MKALAGRLEPGSWPRELTAPGQRQSFGLMAEALEERLRELLGRAVVRFTELGLAKRPRTTLSVGRWWGGTSVSAIPQEAWVELDRLDSSIRRCADAAIAGVNAGANGRSRLQLAVQVIGERPADRTEIR